MQILLPQMHFLLLLLSLVVVAVEVAVVVVVLMAVILINSISSSCGSCKILTWTGKYKLGVGTRAGKYKLRTRAGKYKLRARAGKYKLGARARAGGQARPGGRKTQRPIYLQLFLISLCWNFYHHDEMSIFSF